MLKHTGVSIELFDNEEMLEFVEKGVRGGISVISGRYAKANNKYMTNYDENKPNSYILYLDANNLYGWAMSQYLPIGNYRWKSNVKKFTPKFIKKLKDDALKGYLLEVDLGYPEELHDKHNDYPFCAEHVTCKPSPYMEKIAIESLQRKKDVNKRCDEIKLPKPANIKKLTPNLNDKCNYVIHYRNLKQALENGLILKKVHRVLSFKQSPWLAKYINLNTEKRKNAKNDFEKDFFKLMNNAVFGKTCENLRKRVDIRLVTTPKQLQKLINKPNFKGGAKKISDNLYTVEMAKTCIKYDRPIIVGACVLELSKVLMYDFHYNVIKRKYGEKAKLLFTDTDSLCYHIETEDVYKDMLDDKDLYDFADFPKHHFLHDKTNAKVLGKFKYECIEKVKIDITGETREVNVLSQITEFAGLRAKSYAFEKEIIFTELKEYERNEFSSPEKLLRQVKKAKGVKKNCVKTKIKVENYRNCIFNNVEVKVAFNSIRSFNHKLVTMQSTKVALCAYDDKRWVWDDGITTYAHGHYNTAHQILSD